MSSRSYTPGLAILEPNLQQKVKIQSMLYYQAALFNVFKVLHSLARRFWNQTCNRNSYNPFGHDAAPAPRLGGLTLLGSQVLEPDLQTGKAAIHAHP
jgi:hypothetical protein